MDRSTALVDYDVSVGTSPAAFAPSVLYGSQVEAAVAAFGASSRCSSQALTTALLFLQRSQRALLCCSFGGQFLFNLSTPEDKIIPSLMGKL